MRPKFSIITCAWNSMPYLDESIASVLKQDYQDFEYIFVDGGSTDSTLDRIRAVPRPYRLLENVRGGISAAMNKGLEVAKGEIIAHLHSDDYYLRPDVLSLVAKNLEATGEKMAVWTEHVHKKRSSADGKLCGSGIQLRKSPAR